MKTAFATKIRQLRILENYTSKHVAFYLNVSESTYNRLENAQSANWMKYLPQLLLLYKLDEDQFFIGLAKQVLDRNSEEIEKTQESHIVKLFREEIQKRDALLIELKNNFNELKALSDKQLEEITALKKLA
jgi:transcriptional regulator with XRE-family HTH domain